MAAGVDVVIGHHPHVPQGIGWYADRPVFYSLGNLVFDGQQDRIWTRYGMLARLELEPDHGIGVSACPYVIEGYTPKPLARGSSDGERFRRNLRLWSTSVGGTSLGAADEDGCYAVSPPKRRSPRPRGPLPVGRGSDSLARR
jgi:poly-gamma-glutamate synthesis protein (capsule biosynthesis protein)